MSRLAPQTKRRRYGWLAILLLAILLAIPPPRHQASSARLVERITGLGAADGEAQAGAAKVPLELPEKVSLAGYGPFRGEAKGSRSPLHARALCIDGVAIATLDILEVPESLSAEVERQAKVASPEVRAVLLAATHTHSGPGGFDANPLAELVTRPYDPVVFTALAAAAERAVVEACKGQQPANLRVARTSHPALKRGRGKDPSPDPNLWTLAANATGDGHRIANLVLFGAHPTLLPREERTLSGDWPAAVAQKLDQDGSVAIVAQGTGGDSSVNQALPRGEAAVTAFADRVVAAITSDLDDADEITGPLAYAKVQLLLPSANAGRLFAPYLDVIPHGALDRLFAHWLPHEVPVSGVSIGPLSLLCIPGELTGAAVERWASADPDLDRLPLLTLCGADVSYIEGPEHMGKGIGERLVLYGPELADSMWIAAEAVLSALGSDVAGHR
jgi:neutral ceramidase